MTPAGTSRAGPPSRGGTSGRVRDPAVAAPPWCFRGGFFGSFGVSNARRKGSFLAGPVVLAPARPHGRGHQLRGGTKCGPDHPQPQRRGVVGDRIRLWDWPSEVPASRALSSFAAVSLAAVGLLPFGRRRSRRLPPLPVATVVGPCPLGPTWWVRARPEAFDVDLFFRRPIGCFGWAQRDLRLQNPLPKCLWEPEGILFAEP